ncbi:MAG: hypothetical protein K6U14_10740 [Firmicutes bacterium]|nr:hypothetical protein [Alicyclobacillaceae bacterium]MCL6498088.1 hypothetical protein [Bacillota bacterium]
MRQGERLKVVEGRNEAAPLGRATLQGWAVWAFWGLRVYIVVMTALVVVGFLHGMG